MFNKKQTIIQKIIQNKPSFKNLLKLDKQKIPQSKSKSKSRSNVKRKGKKKISAISPPKSTTTGGRFLSQRQLQNIQQNRSNFQISPSQKSGRRSKKNEGNQIMKKIINMKNKIILLEGNIKDMNQKQKQIQISQRQSSRQTNLKDKEQQNTQKSRTIYQFLGDYQVQIKRQTAQIKSSYISKIEQQLNNQQNNNIIKNLNKSIQPKNYKSPQAGMPKLQQKLLKLNKLLT